MLMVSHPHTHSHVCAGTCVFPFSFSLSLSLSHTQTHTMWLHWCDGKCQARGCKHLSLISYSLCSHLGHCYGKAHWFILHDKYEFFVRQIWKKEGREITAQTLCKRCRFKAQVLSFCNASGSKGVQGTPGSGIPARWQKENRENGLRQSQC